MTSQFILHVDEAALRAAESYCEVTDALGLFADEGPPCPACGGEGECLGTLGTVDWYRCRDCGLDFGRQASNDDVGRRDDPSRCGPEDVDTVH